ncbi:MAG: methyltransferase domain-containing protein [Sphingobacteriales bacterium]|nr:methyltransferase domain-containing protein [Sphingobacteriales bacterium]MCC7222331.1 methyltransferase domain-containing protein [Chitinophagales bacterium]
MNKLRWRIAQFAEQRWWKQYLQHKDKTQYLAWKRQYWTQLLQQLSPPLCLPAQTPVLDAGCGPAGIFIALPQCQVHAIDPLLEQYQKNLPHFDPNDYPYVQFEAVSIEQWQPPTTEYQLIFCLNAINHVANLSLCIDKLCSALAPNGQLVMSIDAHNYTAFKQLFRALPGDILHPHQHDLGEYSAMLEQRGLQITQTLRLKSEWLFDHYLIVGKKPPQNA